MERLCSGPAECGAAAPSTHADGVVVLIQVGEGKGWRTFYRYRTRNGGEFGVGYHFEHRLERVVKATKLKLRAEVRTAVGCPYLQGYSKPLLLTVRPIHHR